MGPYKVSVSWCLHQEYGISGTSIRSPRNKCYLSDQEQWVTYWGRVTELFKWPGTMCHLLGSCWNCCKWPGTMCHSLEGSVGNKISKWPGTTRHSVWMNEWKISMNECQSRRKLEKKKTGAAQQMSQNLTTHLQESQKPLDSHDDQGEEEQSVTMT